ncbi:MAG: DUF1598 domain-containing protein [Pirellulaceae bacterium]|nr:DUF1598 domain-containing protein [Pirellulaceae bacterium]
MLERHILLRWPSLLTLLMTVWLWCPSVYGQGGGGDDDDQNNNGVAGVEIDPIGVLRMKQNNPLVTRQQLMAAKQSLSPQLARTSQLRKISLNRLEKAVASRIASGKSPTAEMVAMAGMTRLQYVFFYPDSGDIVLAGPAEGFGRDSVGRLVGVETQQPCLQLDDVIVALRAFGPGGEKANTISVSIDPTEEGLARMQQVLQQLGGQLGSANQIPVIVNSLQQALGLNTVTIKGVPAGTHFAHVLTEADYRMKLIGIGLEPTPVAMTNYVDRLTGGTGSTTALTRWFFVPDYQSVSVSSDGLSLQLVGNGVKLVDEGEIVRKSGERKTTGRANAASRGYTAEFTKKFPQIAKSHAVYAQLRNLIDLTIAAAFIQQKEMYSQCGWDLGVFANEDGLAVELLPPPRQAATAINAVMRGGTLITPIGGGVAIQARKALSQENLRTDQDGTIAQTRSAVSVDGLSAGQWWWD